LPEYATLEYRDLLNEYENVSLDEMAEQVSTDKAASKFQAVV